MRPPPGGNPYLATIAGGAMMLPLPKTSVLSDVGILSSSTQMYSGSLATSPNRGFLMSSHFGSVARSVTLGSLCAGKPAISRILTHPADRNPIVQRPTTRRTACRRQIIGLTLCIALQAYQIPLAPELALQHQSCGTGSQGNRCSCTVSARTSATRREKSALPVIPDTQVTSR